MEEQNIGVKCDHVPCQCKPDPPGSPYCSLHCKEAVNETDCGCGHMECQAKAYQTTDRN